MGELYTRDITPLIARVAKAHDGLTIAVVSTFSPGDSPQHMRRVEEGLHTLRPYVDAFLPLSVQRVWQVTERLPAWHDTENTIDMAICQTVQGIADLVTQTGLVCLDLMDLRMLFRSSGWATMGSGGASGVEAAMVAAQQALASPWLDINSLPQARSVLVNITSGTDLSVTAIKEVATAIYDQAHPEVWKIFGAVVDAPMQDYVRVTVVAAGLPTPTLC
jgi:cell division protein FtsZ